MRTTRRATGRALGAAALALTCLAGCSAEGPTTLQPAEPSTAEGVRRVSCQLGGEPAVSLVLDLPRAFSEAEREDVDCAWGRDIYPEEPTAFSHYIEIVTVSRVGDDDTLEKIEEKQEPYLDVGGDEMISELELNEDVATIGATIGDRLGWICSCDGQGTLTRMVQADGVRVTWHSLMSEATDVDRALDQALVSAGTAPG